MKFNNLLERLSTIGRFLAAGLLCLSATAFIWHFPFFSNTAAMAYPATNLIATTDAGDKIQEKVSKDAGRAKNFIQETKENVERTASKNASRVDDATDDGNFIERRARRVFMHCVSFRTIKIFHLMHKIPYPYG